MVDFQICISVPLIYYCEPRVTKSVWLKRAETFLYCISDVCCIFIVFMTFPVLYHF